jgi:hypothetical protein
MERDGRDDQCPLKSAPGRNDGIDGAFDDEEGAADD